MKERNLIARNLKNKMMRIKRILLFILLFICSFILTSCREEPAKEENDYKITKLTIYSMNDFHGSIFEDGDKKGIFKIGDYLINEKKLNPDTTIILSAGDMFQGTAVSSMTRGRAIVDCMNIIGFDAMTIGNHEFDWGIEEILKYQDGDPSNGEANFPFIVSNIIDKRTNELASWAKPYTVLEKSGLKVGIIGVIGHDQTNDILASYVKDYEFADEFDAIKKYAKILRTEENCDIVIVSAHLDTEDINNKLSRLNGEYKIDALFNGHTHKAYYGELTQGERTTPLPYVQSGCYGKYVGKIELKYYHNTKEVFDSSSENIKLFGNTENQELLDAISKYQNEIVKTNEFLGISGENLTQKSGAKWASNVIKKYGNSIIGFVNSGGIRSNAFPIYPNDEITYGDIFEMMPFENKIITVELKGSEIKDLYISNYLIVSDGVELKGNDLYIDNKLINDNEYYKVSTVDFLYEKSHYPFMYGKNMVINELLFRDALAEAVKESVNENNKFMPSLLK